MMRWASRSTADALPALLELGLPLTPTTRLLQVKRSAVPGLRPSSMKGRAVSRIKAHARLHAGGWVSPAWAWSEKLQSSIRSREGGQGVVRARGLNQRVGRQRGGEAMTTLELARAGR